MNVSGPVPRLVPYDTLTEYTAHETEVSSEREDSDVEESVDDVELGESLQDLTHDDLAGGNEYFKDIDLDNNLGKNGDGENNGVSLENDKGSSKKKKEKKVNKSGHTLQGVEPDPLLSMSSKEDRSSRRSKRKSTRKRDMEKLTFPMVAGQAFQYWRDTWFPKRDNKKSSQASSAVADNIGGDIETGAGIMNMKKKKKKKKSLDKTRSTSVRKNDISLNVTELKEVKEPRREPDTDALLSLFGPVRTESKRRSDRGNARKSEVSVRRRDMERLTLPMIVRCSVQKLRDAWTPKHTVTAVTGTLTIILSIVFFYIILTVFLASF